MGKISSTCQAAPRCRSIIGTMPTKQIRLWPFPAALCVVLLGALGSATVADSVSEQEAPADFILHAGRIWTGDTARPWAQSLAARGERIVRVGSRQEVDRRRGVLRPGMQCDVSVFDRDLARVPPREIADAKALATIVAGEVCYAAEGR